MKINLNQKLINLIEYYNLINANFLLSSSSLERTNENTTHSYTGTKLEQLKSSNDLIILEELDVHLRYQKYWWLSILIIPLVMILSSYQIISITEGAIMGAIILLLLKTLSMDEAYKSINWAVIFLIGLYSSELCHFLTLSKEGNFNTTVLSYGQFPSTFSDLPPLTMYSPPNFLTIGVT